MNCQTCGAGLVPGAKFCGACGTPTPPPEAARPAQQYAPAGGGGRGIQIDEDARGRGSMTRVWSLFQTSDNSVMVPAPPRSAMKPTERSMRFWSRS